MKKLHGLTKVVPDAKLNFVILCKQNLVSSQKKVSQIAKKI